MGQAESAPSPGPAEADTVIYEVSGMFTGKIGVAFNQDTGDIIAVQDGQGKKFGVQVGWIIHCIDGQPFSGVLFRQKNSGTTPYRLTFLKKVIIKAPQGLSRARDEAGGLRDDVAIRLSPRGVDVAAAGVQPSMASRDRDSRQDSRRGADGTKFIAGSPVGEEPRRTRQEQSGKPSDADHAGGYSHYHPSGKTQDPLGPPGSVIPFTPQDRPELVGRSKKQHCDWVDDKGQRVCHVPNPGDLCGGDEVDVHDVRQKR